MNNGQDDQDASEDKSVMIRFPGDGSIIYYQQKIGLIESNCNVQK